MSASNKKQGTCALAVLWKYWNRQTMIDNGKDDKTQIQFGHYEQTFNVL